MVHRMRNEDAEEDLKDHCAVMWPERWQQLWGTSPAGDMGQAFGGEPEIPVTDASDLDSWFDSLAAQRGMTGAQAEAAMRESAFLGHAEGEGVRV